ncbi:hypothetical protein KAJ89_02650 [Candidatus Parcubacteria bacterium]|nr:hypothetical protein [Candidatus Parcubacteria bacterium]
MSNFQQTVNLKESAEKPEETPAPEERPIKRKKVIRKQRPNGAEAIDEVYQADGLNIEPKPELKQFESVVPRMAYEPMYKRLSMILMVLLVVTISYFLFFFPNRNDIKVDQEPNWYMVKLMNEETYYGLIGDTTADPIIIKSVYYNYDQLNSEESSQPSSGNLRLVKRGKEMHGPDGTLSVVRAQVVFMEPLTEDSKVLKAILNYEN